MGIEYLLCAKYCPRCGGYRNDQLAPKEFTVWVSKGLSASWGLVKLCYIRKKAGQGWRSLQERNPNPGASLGNLSWECVGSSWKSELAFTHGPCSLWNFALKSRGPWHVLKSVFYFYPEVQNRACICRRNEKLVFEMMRNRILATLTGSLEIHSAPSCNWGARGYLGAEGGSEEAWTCWPGVNRWKQLALTGHLRHTRLLSEWHASGQMVGFNEQRCLCVDKAESSPWREGTGLAPTAKSALGHK